MLKLKYNPADSMYYKAYKVDNNSSVVDVFKRESSKTIHVNRYACTVDEFKAMASYPNDEIEKPPYYSPLNCQNTIDEIIKLIKNEKWRVGDSKEGVSIIWTNLLEAYDIEELTSIPIAKLIVDATYVKKDRDYFVYNRYNKHKSNERDNRDNTSS